MERNNTAHTAVQTPNGEESDHVFRLELWQLPSAYKALKMSLTDLAYELRVSGIRVSYQMLSRYANGHSDPGRTLWRRIEDWLDKRLPQDVKDALLREADAKRLEEEEATSRRSSMTAEQPAAMLADSGTDQHKLD